MLRRIGSFFAPPVFEDEDRTRVAGLLNAILLGLLALTVIGTAIVLPLEPEELTFNLVFGGGITAALLGLWLLVRRGYLRIVGSIITFILWLSITILVAMGKGVRDPSIAGYFLVVTVASLLLGIWGIRFFFLLSLLALAGMFIAERMGLIVPTFTEAARIPELMVVAGVLTMVMLTLRAGMGRLQRALDRARQGEQALKEAYMELQSRQDMLAAYSQSLEQRSRYLQASAEMGRALASILEPEQLTGQAVGLLREWLGLDVAALFLVDETGEQAVLEAGAGPALSEIKSPVPVGEEGVGWCITSDQMYVRTPDQMERGREPSAPYEAALPLRVRGQVIGALLVRSNADEGFEQPHLTILQIIADQIAGSLDNVRLLTSTRDALQAVRRAYGELSRKEWEVILHEELTGGYYSDRQGSRPVTGAWPLEMVQAVRENKAVRLQPGVVAVPIRIHGLPVGAVKFCKPEEEGDWTAGEMEMVETLSEQLGVALEGARLYHDIQRRAAAERLVAGTSARFRESLSVEGVLRAAADAIYEGLELDEIVVRLAKE